jgi:hypothetical protein
MSNAAGRTPKIRTDYLSDAQSLIHLARAVRSDTAREKAWLDMIASRLEELAKLLIDAPHQSHQNPVT